VRSACGAGVRAAAQHSQCFHSWFVNVPGLKVALPSGPADAKGLLKAAIRDSSPVIFFEHKGLYNLKGEIPNDPDYVVPLGSAHVARRGSDLTIVATQMMFHHALEAAETLAERGVSAEVIDPRTLVPLDRATLIESVKKTKRALIVDESNITGGVQAELAAVILEDAFDYLDAPIKRLGVPDSPMPLSPGLEDRLLPDSTKIVAAAESLF
jgi:pyruvate dehydrogenase E1 component beta subunit